MKEIASELLVTRLIDWGVDTVFGLPGDGINGLMEGFRRHAERIRFVVVHHEEAAAFMACGYAKATGRLGVCVATSGPGGLHLLNGLYDAKLDHQPVLALTGMQGTKLLGTGFQQEVHLEHVFADVAERPTARVRRARSDQPLRAVGLALEDDAGSRLLVANVSPDETTVVVRGLPEGDGRLRVLDTSTVERATRDPTSFRAEGAPVRVTAGAMELTLGPYGTARVDLPGR